MIEILVVLLTSLANRVRGGLFGDRIRKVIPFYGTTLGRLVLALTVGVSSLLLGMGLITSALVSVGFMVGYLIGPLAPWQFVQSGDDIFALSLRGVILTSIAGIAIVGMHSVIGGLVMFFGGALMGPVYKLGQVLPLVPLFNDNPDTVDKNDTSEVLFGAVIGALLLVAAAL